MDDSFYKSARSQMKRPAIGDTMTLPSPSGKGGYQFRLVKVKSEIVNQVIHKSDYNRRSAAHLTKAAVNDILPSIRELKRNIEPAKAIGTVDNMVLLEGMRRSFAVSLVEDAYFYVWLTDSIAKEDERILVKSADEYQKPTTVDLALSIKSMQDKGDSQALSVRQYAEHFGVSTGTAQNAIAITKIPDQVFKLFPAVKYISIRFLLTLVNVESEKLISIAESIKSEQDEIDLIDESICQKEANKIQSKFRKLLAQNTEQPKELTQDQREWLDLSQTGLVTKIKSDGTLVLEINRSDNNLSQDLMAFLKGR